MKKPKLLIIDGNSLAYRCMYAHKNKKLGFVNSKGHFINTGLAYGFITNLLYLNKEIQPQYMNIVWDGGSDYRIGLYPKYKLTRRINKENKLEKEKNQDPKDKERPHSFNLEMAICLYLMNDLGIQHFRTEGEEADDVIGTLVKKFHKNFRITIASTDYDFMQLLQYENIKLYRSLGKKQEIITKKKFEKIYGFEPKYYPNVLAIGGDRSDEYPGVKGISEKTAINIVKEFGPMLSDIFININNNKIKPRIAKLLIDQHKMLLLCKKLAKIRTDVKLYDKETSFNIEILKNKFKELRFYSLLFEDKLSEIKAIPKKQLEIR